LDRGGEGSWAEGLGSSSTLRLGGLGDSDLLLSGNALPQLGLEGAAGRIEDELGGEVGSDRLGLLSGVKGQGGLVQGEAVDLGVEVKLAGRSGSGGGAAGGLNWAAGGCGHGSLLFLSSDVQQVLKGGSGHGASGNLGTGPGANSGLVLGGGGLLGPLGPGPGRVGDLGVGELHCGGGPEPLAGVDGILNGELVVVAASDLLVAFLGPGLARKSADVRELALLALGVDVAVLAAGDAVHAASLLSEGSVLSNVAEGEAAVGVLKIPEFHERTVSLHNFSVVL
jgi:hypothetical protein